MEADIYIITSRKSPRAGPGRYVSVLEYKVNDREYTKVLRQGRESITPHALELEAVADSLKRFKKPCGIRIHSSHGWFRSVIENGWLDKWKHAGWMNKDRPVPNTELYQGILDTEEKLNLEIISIDDDLGTFKTWLTNEIKGGQDDSKNRSM